MSRAPDQLSLDPSLIPPDPVRNPELDKLVDAVLEAEDAQRAATATKKLRYEVYLAELAIRGLDRYPYVDARTGKKRYLGRKTTTTVAKTNAPRMPKPKDEAKAEKRAEKKQREKDEAVESRRVPRATVADEIGETDGFAGLRQRMAETEH